MSAKLLKLDPPPVNEKDILRYAGCKNVTSAEKDTLSFCMDYLDGSLTYNVCYDIFPCSADGDTVDLTFTSTRSDDLAKNLRDCTGVCVFAATVGIAVDRAVLKYEKLSPAKALFFHAYGAERAESLCDAFNEWLKRELAAEGLKLKPRFSPGYGDLSLALQKDIFAVLNCGRLLGLSLNESLLMTPSKSVTAFIGIY